ncbi:hypothetical protein [Niallia sp. Krafla_26]|uniref:hypothetical protein n=1 Tax=Niallia sp. Krafla_26 TaxID=3064703 RepID=UPI003D177DFC
MMFVRIIGITIILVLIFWLQWSGLKKEGKKLKIAFLSILLVNWFLAVLLVIFPEMPGPGQMVDFIYKSFEPFW